MSGFTGKGSKTKGSGSGKGSKAKGASSEAQGGKVRGGHVSIASSAASIFECPHGCVVACPQ